MAGRGMLLCIGLLTVQFTSHLGVRAWTVGGTQLVSPLTNKESKHPLARAIFMSQS